MLRKPASLVQKPAKKVKASAAQSSQGKAKKPKSEAVLPAESPALKTPEVNADNTGTEFDAKAANVQTPVGAKR